MATAERVDDIPGYEAAHAMIAHLTDLVALVDEQRIWREVSPSVQELLGYRADELVGRDVADVFRGPGIEVLFRPEPPGAIELPVRRASGDIRWFEVGVRRLPDASPISGFVMTGHDVTERRERHLELAARVCRDPLTGLANREQLETVVTKALHRLQRRRDLMALFFLDVDRFKEINDQLGHAAGDGVLIEIARRLRSVLRDEDTAARTGGDEFVICCEDLPDEDEARAIASRVLETLGEPIHLDGGTSVHVSVSIGVAMTRQPVQPASLLSDADAAMYHAKRGGDIRCRMVWSRPASSDPARSPLERARQRGELRMVYQPVIRVGDGRVVGAEALLRRQHPRLGLRSPWPPAGTDAGAEGSHELHLWVVAAVCRWLSDLDLESARPLRGVSINVAPSELVDARFVPAVLATIEEAGIAPTHLSVEVRDGAELAGTRVQRPLASLAHAGVGIIVDGYPGPQSSLTALERISPQALKLHGSLMADLPVRTSLQDRVGGLASVGRSAGAAVVATRVEDHAQEQLLRPLGIDLAQGFHFSRPLSGQVFAQRYGRERFADPSPRPSMSDEPQGEL